MAANKEKNVKQVLNEALQVVANISLAAGTINPIFSVAGRLIQVVLHQVDDEDLMKKIKCEFENMNQNLNQISEQNQQTLRDVRKRAAANKYANIERHLRNQFQSYEEMVNAKPEKIESKKDDFIKNYESNKDDNNMNDLYMGVVGIPQVFSEPVLKVYWECSQGDKRVMKDLCTHLAYLLVMGYTTMMTYYAFKGENMKLQKDEWEKKMKKMQEVMAECM